MKLLTHKNFNGWMETYGRASVQNDLRVSADLFAQDARYYESPFDEPIIGRDAIFDDWNIGAQNLQDKESTSRFFLCRTIAVLHAGDRNSLPSNRANASCWIACSWSSLTTKAYVKSSANGGISAKVLLRSGRSPKTI